MIRFSLDGLTIRVSVIVFLLLPFALAFGLAGQFLFLFAAVTWHETAHVLAAYRFGLHTVRIDITPIGEVAVIPHTEALPVWKRLCILLAGPASSLALAGLCYAATASLPVNLTTLIHINLAIGLFNLLPFVPLDGGRVVEVLLARAIGALTACRITQKFSTCGGLLLMAAGFLQAALFPLNFSLLCIGLYLRRACREAHFTQAFAIYQGLAMTKQKAGFRKYLPVKTYSVPSDMPVKTVFARLNWDTFHIYHLRTTGCCLTEQDILAYIRENGLQGVLSDIVPSLYNREKCDTMG